MSTRPNSGGRNDGSSDGSVIELQTPEHLPVRLARAPIGTRAMALILDILILIGAVLVFSMVGGAVLLSSGDMEDGFIGALFQLGLFLIVNFYFIGTELRWQGRTVGKRAMGLRVVARDGGPLTPGMIFARNLTRDIELLYPVLILLTGGALFDISNGWIRLCAMLWTVAIILMPLFNRDRARIGDLIAGTVVVLAPRAKLLKDLGDLSEPSRLSKGQDPSLDLHFTEAQLDEYGIHELGVLESVLRRPKAQWDEALIADIAARIKTRIRWEDPKIELPNATFLHTFYRAQRARLEQRMLFGDRRESKNHRADRTP